MQKEKKGRKKTRRKKPFPKKTYLETLNPKTQRTIKIIPLLVGGGVGYR